MIAYALGPFFVIGNLEIVIRILIAQKVHKTLADDLIGQLLLGLLFFYAYLIKSKCHPSRSLS